MDSFDPAINYGPNDAGITAGSIILVVVAILFGSWLLGAIYGLITSYIQKLTKKED